MKIIGVDEVGRGCWAGPLVAGAVLLHDDVPGLKDSKKLSKVQRQKLSTDINASHASIGIGWVTPAEVDSLGLTEAVRTAMERAVAQIQDTYDAIIVDGNYNFLSRIPNSSALIKADDTVPAVSAASIVAKVARDTYMEQLAHEYPGYGFEAHVGYGTAKHSEALELHGVTEIHRRSYKPIQKYL